MAKKDSQSSNDAPAGDEITSTAPDEAPPQPAADDAAFAAGEAAGQQVVQQTIHIDDSAATAGYANFCRVSYTPEELILDLGLNPQPFGAGETTVKVNQRIILNFFTAKRLLNALAGTLQRHEQAFGVLETDVRKRVRQS